MSGEGRRPQTAMTQSGLRASRQWGASDRAHKGYLSTGLSRDATRQACSY